MYNDPGILDELFGKLEKKKLNNGRFVCCYCMFIVLYVVIVCCYYMFIVLYVVTVRSLCCMLLLYVVTVCSLCCMLLLYVVIVCCYCMFIVLYVVITCSLCCMFIVLYACIHLLHDEIINIKVITKNNCICQHIRKLLNKIINATNLVKST